MFPWCGCSFHSHLQGECECVFVKLRWLLLSVLVCSASHRGAAAASASAAQGSPDTVISGGLDFGLTYISESKTTFKNKDDKKGTTKKTDNTGIGYDFSGLSLALEHRFNDKLSFTASVAAGDVKNESKYFLYTKEAYLKYIFSKEAVLSVGLAKLPWYALTADTAVVGIVDNPVSVRLGYTVKRDWGFHLGGSIGSGKQINYAVSVVNGKGYKADRSKGMDIAGGVSFVPFDGLTLAAGGYSGVQGKKLQTNKVVNKAQRANVLVNYRKDKFNVGATYFAAKNWNNVQTTVKPAKLIITKFQDKASGYSVWGSAGLSDVLTAFARYDNANLKKALSQPFNKDVYGYVGLQYAVSDNLTLAGVYKREVQDLRPGKGAFPPKKGVKLNQLKNNQIGIYGEVSF